MKPPININDDQQLAGAYQECIDMLDINDLEAVGERADALSESIAEGLREAMKRRLLAADDKGLSRMDFGKLVVLNGLTIMAVTLYKERLAGQN